MDDLVEWSGIEAVLAADGELDAPGRGCGQSIPASSGRVHHILVDQQEPIAVILDGISFPAVVAFVREPDAAGGVGEGQEAELAAERGGAGCGGAGEEGRVLVHVEVDEDAAEREREQIRAQEAAGVDGGAPGPAYAAGPGDPARLESAEDVGEHVVGQHGWRL